MDSSVLVFLILKGLFLIYVLHSTFWRPTVETSTNDQEGTFQNLNERDDKNNQNNEDVRELLVIQFCFSQEAHLNIIKAYLTAEYPSVTVETTNYPLPPIKAFLKKFQQQIHWVMAGLFLLGHFFFTYLGFTYPAWLTPILKNKNLIMAVAMLVSVLLLQYASKTGAFEVLFNDKLVFSKLQKGYLPTTQNFDEILLK